MLISNKYGVARNPEIDELIWGHNQFVSGRSDAEPNAGLRGRVGEYGKILRTLPERQKNPVAAIGKLHGFNASCWPKCLHYQPKPRPDLKNVVLADPTSSTQPIPASDFEACVDYIGRDFGFERRDVQILQPKITGIYGRDTLAGNPVYAVANIFEWVDAIASCWIFIGTEAFGQSVAAQYRGDRPSISLHSTMGFNEEIFLWPNVTYKTASNISRGDFHPETYPA